MEIMVTKKKLCFVYGAAFGFMLVNTYEKVYACNHSYHMFCFFAGFSHSEKCK
jgi:hypothetical protein